VTAFGMFLAIEAALHKRGRAVDGTVVAIHGAGKIALSLCRRLQEAGAHLQVTDAARRRPCDVLVACARGAATSALLAATPATLVCAVPDACLDPRDVDALHARGVLSLPPELAAAGGLIHAVRLHLSPGSQEEPVAEIVDFAWRTRKMLSEAAGRDPRHVVRRWLDAARALATARA
jgi:glutamate dehydrogenase/leucine dehydrogenase